MNRASLTAVCPRLGRKLGMISRQLSCGVRIAVSPSRAISGIAARNHVAAAIWLHEARSCCCLL